MTEPEVIAISEGRVTIIDSGFGGATKIAVSENPNYSLGIRYVNEEDIEKLRMWGKRWRTLKQSYGKF